MAKKKIRICIAPMIRMKGVCGKIATHSDGDSLHLCKDHYKFYKHDFKGLKKI